MLEEGKVIAVLVIVDAFNRSIKNTRGFVCLKPLLCPSFIVNFKDPPIL